MRLQLLMLPAALVAPAAQADTFLSVEQAQALLFPGATMTPADFTMTEAQIDDLIKATKATVYRSKVKVWRASTGGWFFVDQVAGRDDRVTYALALDAQGVIKGVEVLICLPTYSGVRAAEWRDQFQGRTYDPALDLNAAITTISGQTLTTAHITEGVQRLLATHALFMARKAG